MRAVDVRELRLLGINAHIHFVPLVCLQAVNGDVCVCVFPSLDCIVEKKVASQRPIAPSLTCLTGTGASGRLRTVQW